MTIDFKTSAEAYAAHNPGIRRAYDRAHTVSRFTFSNDPDDYPWTRHVPAVAHVWEHLIRPTLDPAAPINEDDIRASLNALPRRFNGGQGHRTPRPGREHLEETRDATRDLAPYYAGLYAALHMVPSPGNDFDREAYLADLFKYGATHARTSASAARRVRAHRARKADAERAAILAAFTEALDAGDITPGEPITREALVEAIGMGLDTSISDRRIFETLRAADAVPLTVTERQATVHMDGVRTRARVFIFTETATTEQTEEPPMNAALIAELDSVAESADRATAALERFQLQQERMLAGDRFGALTTQREGFHTTSAPVADLTTYRARRAA